MMVYAGLFHSGEQAMAVFFFFFFTLFTPSLSNQVISHKEVVGWCEGAVYLTSPGRPTDIGLQLGKARYPCSG